MIRRFAAVGVLVLSCAIAAPPVEAHPHVFIDHRVTFVFDGGRVTALQLQWVTDELFSDSLLLFDTDKDGSFAESENNELRTGILADLELTRYYTYIWVDGRQLDPIKPVDFIARVDENRIVTFDMMVPLPNPVDPRSQALAVEIYDPNYFVAIELAKTDPVALKNAEGIPCGATVRDDTENVYFGGVVMPQEIALQCH